MEMLDQSEVDALLASVPDPSNKTAQPVAAGQDTDNTERQELLPELLAQFKLTATSGRLARLLPIRVAVRVRLAERNMDISQLLDLTVGTIIEFDRAVDSELALVVNNTPIGTGNAVKCGENFGLRVIRILPWAQELLAKGLIR